MRENKGQRVAYVRVSTVEQNEARQLEAMEKYDIDKYFKEKASAKDTNRPQLKTMLDYVRKGDTVYVHDFSRLAGNTADLLKILRDLENKGVNFISNKENINTSTATGKLMLAMIGAIAEFEITNMKERQAEETALAKEQALDKEQSKYKGRKKIEIPEDVFAEAYQRYMNREINKAQMSKELNVSRLTLDKLIKEYREQHNINR